MAIICKQSFNGGRRHKLPLNGFEIVLNSSGNKDKAIIIDIRFVTGMQPTILPKLCSLLGLLIIARRAPFGANQKFSDVANFNFNPRNGFTDGTNASIVDLGHNQ